MILKNNSARLITINGKMNDSRRLESYKINPGNNPAVDVPDRLCDNVFVKGLLESGAVLKVGESAEVEPSTEGDNEPSQYDEMNKADLTSLAESLGIEVKSAWNKAQIIAEIEKLDAE